MTAAPPIRLLIADDHLVVRMGLAAVLEHHPAVTVVAMAGDGDEAIALHRRHRPDVTLIDLRMPRCDGIAAIRAIRAESPAARVLMLTTYDTEEDVHRAIAAGACGYLLKSAGGDELVAAVEAAHRGEEWLPEAIRRQLAQRSDDDALTGRQVEVLELLARGLSNKEIGARLGISEDGAKAHVKKIYQRLHVADRAEAVTAAVRRGIIHLDGQP